VELIDARGAVNQTVKLQLSKGTAAGDFALPDTLQAGNYRLRAYTNYMRNAGSEYFFDEAISIINSISTAVSKTTGNNMPGNIAPAGQVNSKASLQFFPEGGSLIVGVRSVHSL
jgi:hypothetical protein